MPIVLCSSCSDLVDDQAICVVFSFEGRPSSLGRCSVRFFYRLLPAPTGDHTQLAPGGTVDNAIRHVAATVNSTVRPAVTGPSGLAPAGSNRLRWLRWLHLHGGATVALIYYICACTRCSLPVFLSLSRVLFIVRCGCIIVD